MKKRNSRKVIPVLVVAVIWSIFCTVPVRAAEDTDVIHIYTAEDLIDFAEQCSLDTWSQGKTVSLEQDISLKEIEFLPIPTFGGIFDGNGHTISDIEIQTSVAPAGLFGQLQEGGTIKNLNVTGTVSPTGEASAIGGIVGENNGLIENCVFTGNISGKTNCGGIAGINAMTGVITESEASGAVFGENMTGGIAGYNLGQISSCQNHSYVNIASVDPVFNLEDINLDFLTDISKLSSVDTSTATNDTGGIAGYSSGVITACENVGAVGYQHIGYNVGGIVGRSCGYIFSCVNKAEIYGRKDVGGIVGQMEPYIDMNMTEDTLSKLRRQLKTLNGMINSALDDAHAGTGTITKRLNRIADCLDEAATAAKDINTYGSVTSTVSGSGESSGDGNITASPPQIEIGGLGESSIDGEGSHSANANVNAETQIHLNTSLHGLSAAVNEMAAQMRLLNGEVSDTSGTMNVDLKAISNQIDAIADTLFDAVLGTEQEDVVQDTSLSNIDSLTLGKAASCSNTGDIYGDINVGGIAGVMGIEYTLDPEDDLSGQISGTQRRKYELKAVVQNCRNDTSVTAKRNYAGGICGRMDLGFITLVENYGEIKSESGDYVGGICGITGATIRYSFSKCTLSGGSYVGGITGSGVDEANDGESSSVSGCFSIVDITDYEQFIGAISGANAGTFIENYFVSDDLAGINRVSYSEQAEPVLYDELAVLVSELKEKLAVEIPSAFQIFTLRFVCDGEIIKEETFSYGASFDDSIYPELPQKTGYHAAWDLTELSNLHNDTTVTAIYIPYITALKSDALRENGRSVFYVEGQFTDSSFFTAKETDSEEVSLNGSMLESWTLSFSDDGLSMHTVRYHPPNGETDHVKIYVKQDGEWDETETTANGRYLLFSVNGHCADITVVQAKAMNWLWAVYALILICMVFLLWICMPVLKNILKHKKICRVLLILVVLGAAVFGGYKALPGLMKDYRAYELLKAFAAETEWIMELNVDAKFKEDSHCFSAVIDRTQVGDTSVTAISKDGLNFYFSDGILFLENGIAYQLGEDTADDSQLLEMTLELYRYVDITLQDHTYCITAGSEDAAKLLKILMPDIEAGVEPEQMEIQMTEEEGKLSKITFQSNGRLEGTSYALSVTLKRCSEEQTRIVIPESVLNHIMDGTVSVAGALSENILTLISAWMELNNREIITADVTVTADCGPLSIDETFVFKRSDPSVNSINLMDIAYNLCMEADFEYAEDGSSSNYIITLKDDDIQKIVHSVVPETEGMDLIFDVGTMRVTVCDGIIEEIFIECSGSMDVLLTEVPIGVSTRFDIKNTLI